jgi:hypothetical protein
LHTELRKRFAALVGVVDYSDLTLSDFPTLTKIAGDTGSTPAEIVWPSSISFQHHLPSLNGLSI